MRQKKEKHLLIEQLKKTPIIQIACEKTNIGRATYYRWRKEDPEFAKLADEALLEGRFLVSDIAESQIISLIKDKKIEAIKFWLAHNNPRYAQKLELSGTVSTKNEHLTVEQKKFIRKALKLSSLRNHV